MPEETYDEKIKRQHAESAAAYKQRTEACPEHYWRWDRSRCEVCGMELSDYIPQLLAKLDDVTRERDMLLQDLRAQGG